MTCRGRDEEKLSFVNETSEVTVEVAVDLMKKMRLCIGMTE